MAVFHTGMLKDAHSRLGNQPRRKLAWKENVKRRCRCCPQPVQPLSALRATLVDYGNNTNLHGLRYLTEKGLAASERCLWILMCTVAVLEAAYIMQLSWNRFATSPTVSVIDNINYAIANIPFPSVTLCDNNPVQWDKAKRFQKTILGDVSDSTSLRFQNLLEALISNQYKDFLFNQSTSGADMERIRGLEHINITQLMTEVMPGCETIFPELCWWRNNEYNCCSIFELQRTKLGFCYSFNSEISENQAHKASGGQGKCKRPRRTNRIGLWGGLRVTVQTQEGQESPGVALIIENPWNYPTSSQGIAAGQSGQAEVSASVTYATSQVRNMKLNDRKCLFGNELDTLGLGVYIHQNCMTECQQKLVKQHCNCSSYIYPHQENVRDCHVSDLFCLAKFNDVQHRVNDGEEMKCLCMMDCEPLEYTSKLLMSPYNDPQKVLLDIHFHSPAIIQYRTDLVFGMLDLLVSLGGIAGLFLGCSVLSVAELVYFLTVRFYCHLTKSKKYLAQQMNAI